MMRYGCPDCRGKGEIFALVDGPSYSGPQTIRCTRCHGSGKIDAAMERWMLIGGTHRTWRVAQGEGQRECSKRLGLSLTELSSMESGRADPSPLLDDIPAELRSSLDGGEEG